MRLFEIELNSNFSFKSKSPFFNEAEFERFYRLNNISLSSQKNEFESYLYTDIVFKAQNYSIFVNRFTYRRDEHETLKRIINMNIYEAYYSHGKNNTRTQLTKDLFGCSEERTLYPSWQFFYIGLSRLMFDKYNQEEFIKNISYFNNLSETLWKEHLILNSQNDLTFENNTVAI